MPHAARGTDKLHRCMVLDSEAAGRKQEMTVTLMQRRSVLIALAALASQRC
jgi:hypothetical protein